MKEIIINKIEYGLIDIKRIQIHPDGNVWLLDNHHPIQLQGVMGYEALLDGIHMLNQGDKVDIKIKNKRWNWIYNLIILKVNFSTAGTKVIFAQTDRTRISISL